MSKRFFCSEVLLRVRSGVQLHCCAPCLQALEMNSEPGGESVEDTRLFHTKMKLTLYFLRNETEPSFSYIVQLVWRGATPNKELHTVPPGP